MRPQQSGRIVRQRKLQKNAFQQILREDQIESAEYDALQGQYKVETGVEKSEENEYHLQAALAAGSGEKDYEKEIPAPPAQESKDINYDALYSLVFDKPATYIRFSQTVEECTGCQYDMTTEDNVFLKTFNQKRPVGSRLSEDDFEKIMEVFEETADFHTPFAAVDNTVVPFETMKVALKQQMEDQILSIANQVYEYWKTRRQELSNRPIQPSLKFETHQDNDDGDPYLKRLRKELEEGRELIAMAHRREVTKRELMNVDRSIFEQRAKVKEAKVRLGIKTDDEDLINQKPQKRKITDFSQLDRGPGSQLRIPGRPDARPIDADLKQLSTVLTQKENAFQQIIENKVAQHRVWNKDYVDLTREPLSPVFGQSSESSFRPARAQYQYLMTPPSSVNSDSFDHPSPIKDKPDESAFRYSTPPEEDEHGQPAYRRRIGRCGRLWIDRRGMSTAARDIDDGSDRWKYDQDDDDEPPIYEVDPYDTNALRFRATVPLLPHLYPRTRQEDKGPQSTTRHGESSPANNQTTTPQSAHPPTQPQS
ncbi:hypothetical protein B7494_g1273 [Chlorociboria aeruginascens]|nr:hypothetical protein B7494_g1273 [Chlorociboria aeruginascens]